MAEKLRYPAREAMAVARELVAAIKPATERLVVAGSLRRRKPEVGDIEILFVPRVETEKIDLFHTGQVDQVEKVLAQLLADGVIERRLNANGHAAWGGKNKLALHVASGIPVDLFATTEPCWWNYLVCRTGPSEFNIRICQKAKEKGWKWEPYGSGFSRGGPLAGSRETVAMESERQVFKFVDMPYLEPWERR